MAALAAEGHQEPPSLLDNDWKLIPMYNNAVPHMRAQSTHEA